VLNLINQKTTLSEIQTNNNTWSGSNTFNTLLPTSTVTPSNNNDLTTKLYVDSQVSTKPSLTQIQNNNNIWLGSNTFSNFNIINTINNTQLQINPGFNDAVLDPTVTTYVGGATHFFKGILACHRVSAVNGCTLGNGNDLSVVRKNLNVDNVLRIGYASGANETVTDSVNVTVGLSNNANLDVRGNIYLTGTINSTDGLYATQNYVTSAISLKADIAYIN